MKKIKNVPNWLCHTVFHKKLNSSDLKLFYVLIYMCSEKYYKSQKVSEIYKIEDIKKMLNSKSDIRSGLEKLDGLEITVNYFKSYTVVKGEKKDRKTFIPFRIKFNKTEKGNIEDIIITVDEDFIKAFDNPNPKFSVSYRYLNYLNNTQYQLLYIYLADRVAKMEYRTKQIDTRDLIQLLNRKKGYKLDDLNRDIRECQAILDNGGTDIKFDYKINKIVDKYNKDKIAYECSFDIYRTKPQPFYKRHDNFEKVFVEKKSEDNNLDEDDIDLVDSIIKDIVDIYQESYTMPIRSMRAFREHIKKEHNLVANKKNILYLYNVIIQNIDIVENNENITLDSGKPNVLAFGEIDNYIDYYTISDEYLLYKNDELFKETIEETIDFIYDSFHIYNNLEAISINTMNEKYKLSRLRTGAFLKFEYKSYK